MYLLGNVDFGPINPHYQGIQSGRIVTGAITRGLLDFL